MPSYHDSDFVAAYELGKGRVDLGLPQLSGVSCQAEKTRVYPETGWSQFVRMTIPPWRQWLLECRDLFGEAPRRFDRTTKQRLLVNPP
jgi:hypothetical protein